MTPFLAFSGQGRDALAFYLNCFPDAKCTHDIRYGENEEGTPDTLRLAVLQIGEATLRMIDTPGGDEFRFSAAMSVFAECETAGDVDSLAAKLGQGGKALMPADTYPFADRFAWIADRFGVNWQLICGKRLEV